MTDTAEGKSARLKTAAAVAAFLAAVVLIAWAFLRAYNPYIDDILYAERLSQMEEVTTQLFTALEDAVNQRWQDMQSQCNYLAMEQPATVEALSRYMTRQTDANDMDEKLMTIVAVDTEGRYYTKDGPQGKIRQMNELIDEPARVSYIVNSMTADETQVVFLQMLGKPINLMDGDVEVRLVYCGVMQRMEAFNPYFECKAYNGHNSVYVLDADGLKIFKSGGNEDELLHGYNVYTVLNDMEYLHGSSFAQTQRALARDGVAFSNAVLDGVEYYYALRRLENADWTLMFLIPSEYVAVNTVRLMNSTTMILLTFACITIIVFAAFIFIVLTIQKRRALEAERRNSEALAKANEELTHAVDAAQTAYQTAQAASRAKSDFLANMSHDIRTPMNAIMGMTTLIDHEADSPKKVRGYVGKIRTSSKQLLSIINDVLDMSKIESGKTVLNNAPFDVPELVKQIEDIFRPQTDAKGQVFEVEMSPISQNRVVGDSVRLLQILNNLLSNAVKYTPVGGTIRLEVEEVRRGLSSYERLVFRVRDTGIGMSREYLQHIFESFSREESSLTNTVQGTGLGMAIVKNLVDLMGGIIRVQSEQGKGSCFEVTIAFKIVEGEEAKPAEAHRDSAPVSLAGLHFLCAEDNELNAEILTELLHMEGATCEICTNGQYVVDAFERAKPDQYDMILMDIQMPVMNGYDAARAIRSGSNPQGKTIPIFAMTANAFSEDIQRSLDAGMNGHISKPVDMDNLKKNVGWAMGR